MAAAGDGGLRGSTNMLLPAINGSGTGSSPQSRYAASSNESRMYPYGNPFQDIGSSKIAQLEGRMEMTERANRALLEETVRLQGEVKQKARKNEDMLKDEISERLRLNNTVNAVTETGQRAGARLTKLEDVVNVDNKSLSAFIKYVKQMEKQHMTEMSDIKYQRSQDSQQLQALRSEMDGGAERAGRSREQSDKRLLYIVEEIRQLKSRAEIQLNEMRESSSDFRQRSQQLAQEQLATTEAIKSIRDSQAMAEASNSALRVDMDSKMRQMEQEVVDLQQRLGSEENARRKVEEEAKRIISEFNRTMVDHERQTRDSLSAIANALAEVRDSGTKSQEKLLEKVQEIVEVYNQKGLDSSAFLRQEMETHFGSLEEAITTESQNRSNFEASSREESKSRWNALESRLQEDVGLVKSSIKIDQMHTQETFTKLNEQIALMDRQSHQQSRTIEQTLRSEIKQRLKEESKAASSMEVLMNKVEGVRNMVLKHEAETDRMVQENRETLGMSIKTKVEDAQQETMRTYADSQMQMAQLQRKFGAMKDQIQKETTAIQKETAKVHHAANESLAKFQGLSQQQFEAVETKLNIIPHQVTKTEERVSIIKSDLEAKIQSEITKRLREVQVFRSEMDKKVADSDYSKTMLELRSKIDEMEQKMSNQTMKLSQSEHEVNVVRQTLTKTLHTEAATRMEAVMDLKREFVKLQAQNEFLIKQRDYNDTNGEDLNIASQLSTRTENPQPSEFWKVLEESKLLQPAPSTAEDRAKDTTVAVDNSNEARDSPDDYNDASLLAKFVGEGGEETPTSKRKSKKKKRGKKSRETTEEVAASSDDVTPEAPESPPVAVDTKDSDALDGVVGGEDGDASTATTDMPQGAAAGSIQSEVVSQDSFFKPKFDVLDEQANNDAPADEAIVEETSSNSPPVDSQNAVPVDELPIEASPSTTEDQQVDIPEVDADAVTAGEQPAGVSEEEETLDVPE